MSEWVPTAAKAENKQKKLYCSFCGKDQHEVQKLIAGPSTFICDECVVLCMSILLEEGKQLKGHAAEDMRGLLAQLTPEQRNELLGMDAPEYAGGEPEKDEILAASDYKFAAAQNAASNEFQKAMSRICELEAKLAKETAFNKMIGTGMELASKQNEQAEAVLLPFADAHAASINPEFGGSMEDLIKPEDFQRAYELIYQPERFKNVK